ncbi:MAG TPA: GntR family transcriptional regulator [Devosiaceae bacterium]|nr:GntR family transcriptional regulator [Devosiaceae bacterium]
MLDTDGDKKLAQKAYSALRSAITHLRLPPGQAYLEREIVDALGISRTPVREALVRLEVEGWIRIIPRRGFSVSPIGQNELQQMYDVVENLDGLAGRLAAALVNDNQLNELEALIGKQSDALDADDLESWAELDDKFHSKIVEFAQNPRLSAIMDSQSDWIYRARLYTINLRPKPTRSINEHTAIVGAMRAASLDATQIMMQAHRHRAREEILEALRLIQGGA